MSPYLGIFSRENTPEELTSTHKSSFFSYKQVSGRNGDHDDLEWPMLSYYVIYCEKFRKVLQRTEKVALTEIWKIVFQENGNGRLPVILKSRSMATD